MLFRSAHETHQQSCNASTKRPHPTAAATSNFDVNNASIDELLGHAREHTRNDQILTAARYLRKALDRDTNLKLDNDLAHILHLASRVEATIVDLSKPPDPSIWTLQGNSHHKDMKLLHYYKLDSFRRLTSRIEFLMDKALLTSMGAVLIETELYNTWIPRWRIPSVGIRNVQKLGELGRTQQILHVELDIPWRRELILVSNGAEEVEANGLLAIHLGSRNNITEDSIQPFGKAIILPPETGIKRIDFEGCFVFQKCPKEHPLLHDAASPNTASNSILVSFSMYADAKVPQLFPQWIVNFVLSVAIERIFTLLVSVARDVKAGKSPEHSTAMATKRDCIYGWLDERTEVMLHR